MIESTEHDADSMSAAAVRIAMLFEERGIAVPTPDTDVIDGGLLDSLALVELLLALEETFDVTIAFEQVDLQDLRTINRMARLMVGEPSSAASE